MKNIGSLENKNRNGFKQTITRYQTKKCEGCHLQHACNPVKNKRGIEKRKQRCYDEPVFANIKHNHLFKRFLHRGIKKVSVETGLVAIAHNLRRKTV